MRARLVLLLILLLSGIAGVEGQFIYRPPPGVPTCPGGSSPIAANQHPRILVTTCNLEDQVTKISTGGRLHTTFQQMVDGMNTSWSTLATPGIDGRHYQTAAGVGYVIQTWGTSGVDGISYGAHPTRAEWVTKLVEILETAIDPVWLDGGKLGYAQSMAAAIDWAWADLDPALIAEIGEIVVATCDGRTQTNFPNQNVVGTDTSYIWANCSVWQMLFQGSGIETAWVNSWDVEDRLFSPEGAVAVQSFLLGNGGGDAAQGPSYYPQYGVEQIFSAIEAYRRAYALTTTAFYADGIKNMIINWPIYVAYNRRPEEPTRQYVPFYSEVDRDWGQNETRQMAHQASLAALDGVDNDKRDLAKWVEENLIGVLSPGASLTKLGGFFLALAPSTTFTAKSPTTLGLPPTLFDPTGGRIFLRRDHTSTDAPLVTLTVQKWAVDYNGRYETCPGGWAVYLNGYVTGRKQTVSGHEAAGFARAGTCNGFYMHDTVNNGPASSYPDFGGSRFITVGFTSTSDLVANSLWDTLADLRYDVEDASHAATYLWQDLSRAYNGAAIGSGGYDPNRITAYESAKIYLRPADPNGDLGVFVMRDDITTPSINYIPTDANHFGAEPTLDGSTPAAYTIAPTCANYVTFINLELNRYNCVSSSNHGHVSSTDATLITATVNANMHDHKVWIKYFTSGITMIKAGGANEEANTWTAPIGDAPWSLENVDPYATRWHTGGGGVSAKLKQLLLSWTVRTRYTTPSTTTGILKAVAYGRSGDATPTFTAYTGTNFDCVRVGSLIGGLTSGGIGTSQRTSGTCVFNGLAAATYTLAWGSLASGTTRTFTPGSDINLGAGAGMAQTCNVAATGGLCQFTMTLTGGGSGAARTITVS